jgi:homoserine dehydrogenase
VKVCVLSNVLMGADIRTKDVDRTGIRGITAEMIGGAASRERRYRLICSSKWEDGAVAASVAPEEVLPDDPAYHLPGTTSVVQLRTDTLNQLTLLETAPTPAQTAFGVLADLISRRREDTSRDESEKR